MSKHLDRAKDVKSLILKLQESQIIKTPWCEFCDWHMNLCKFGNCSDSYIYQCGKCKYQLRIKAFLYFDKRTLPINVWYLLMSLCFSESMNAM